MNSEKLTELIFKLNKYGVLNNTVGIGELKAYFDKHDSLDQLIQNIKEKRDTRLKGIKNIPKKISNFCKLKL